MIVFVAGLPTTHAQESEQAATKKRNATSGELYETIALYPLKSYGAIEVGEHRFCHEEKGSRTAEP